MDEANTLVVPHARVVAGADYGDNPAFSNGLEARGERYVVGVRANFSVALKRSATEPVRRADTLLQAWLRRSWQTIRWREGSNGWLRAKFVAIRCWRVEGDARYHFVSNCTMCAL